MNIEKSIFDIDDFIKIIRDYQERLNKVREKVGDILLEIRSGKIRITEEQLLRLQKMDSTLTREQVSLVEKGKIYVKK